MKPFFFDSSLNIEENNRRWSDLTLLYNSDICLIFLDLPSFWFRSITPAFSATCIGGIFRPSYVLSSLDMLCNLAYVKSVKDNGLLSLPCAATLVRELVCLYDHSSYTGGASSPWQVGGWACGQQPHPRKQLRITQTVTVLPTETWGPVRNSSQTTDTMPTADESPSQEVRSPNQGFLEHGMSVPWNFEDSPGHQWNAELQLRLPLHKRVEMDWVRT